MYYSTCVSLRQLKNKYIHKICVAYLYIIYLF
nr:MAG TPA: hypothetical protein [Caudoviricetes sp.]